MSPRWLIEPKKAKPLGPPLEAKVETQVLSEGELKVVTLTGSIDQRTDLHALVGAPSGPMRFRLGGVSRVSSAGVRPWMEYFGEAQRAGFSVALMECSVALTPYFGQMRGFRCGASVESVFAPLRCAACALVFERLIDVREPGRIRAGLDAESCEKCGTRLELDDVFDEYFDLRS